MGSINIQFYGIPSEILRLIENLRKKFGLRVVISKDQPEFGLFELDSLDEIASPQVPAIFSILLGFDEPNLNAKSEFDFLTKNPRFLPVILGKLRKEGLGESTILGRTEDPRLLATWKAMAREIKKSTKAGLWGFNPETKAKAFYRSFRYTTEAYELSRAGTPLRSVSPLIVFSVEEPK